jgi:hypothetical protein
MSGRLLFVMVWSMLCLSITLAVMCRDMDIVSLAGVLLEIWLVNVGMDICQE